MSILDINVDTFDPLAQYFEGLTVIDDNITDNIPWDLAQTIKTIRIPEGVTTLRGTGVFNVFDVEKIILPSTLAFIGSGVFEGLSTLKEINLEDCAHLDGINRASFCGCTGLTEIVLPDGLGYIGEEAFLGCKNLRSINIPRSVKSIYTNAFVDCKNLKKVDMGACTELLQLPNGAFANCIWLEEAIMPPNCVNLGDETFIRCESLVRLVAPKVKYVGAGCFTQCICLRSIELSDSTAVWHRAFRDCIRLREAKFVCLGGAPADAFEGCWALKEIAVRPNKEGIIREPEITIKTTRSRRRRKLH